jgi:hypothetical protein
MKSEQPNKTKLHMNKKKRLSNIKNTSFKNSLQLLKLKNTKTDSTQQKREKPFKMNPESLPALTLSSDLHKNVYKHATRLLCVLLEKFRQSFFDVGQPSIGGNVNLKKTQSPKNHGIHINFNNNIWEN